MLYAFLSDIHSNIEALQTILNFFRRKPIRHWVILGDLVGYGPNPNDVISTVLKLRPRTIIRGNHDRVAAGLDEPHDFNEIAGAAALWTRAQLTSYHRRVLAELPEGPLVLAPGLNISHGSPIDEDMYVLSDFDAYVSFRETREDFLFCGHTHIPSVFTTNGNEIDVHQIPPHARIQLRLSPGKRYLINPGSVGQPRDRCPHLSACTFNPRTRVVTYYRVPYPFDRTMAKIHMVGLPEFLAFRLERGI